MGRDKERQRVTEKRNGGDFPGGPGFENLPSNGEDAGSIPGWGTKIPRVTTTEPMSSRAYAPQ